MADRADLQPDFAAMAKCIGSLDEQLARCKAGNPTLQLAQALASVQSDLAEIKIQAAETRKIVEGLRFVLHARLFIRMLSTG